MINSAKNKILDKYKKVKNEDFKIFEYDFSQTEFREDLNIKNLGVLSDELKDYYKTKFFCVFSNIINSKPILVFSCTPDLCSKGIDCSKIAKETSKMIKGGGGGKPEFSQAGGSDVSKIKDARNYTLELIKKSLGII